MPQSINKQIFLIALMIIFSFGIASGEDESVVLKWKIPEGGYIAYKTSFAGIDDGASKIDIDPALVFKEGNIPDAIQEKIASLPIAKMPSSFSVLTPGKEGKIKVRIAFGSQKPTTEDSQQPDTFDVKNVTVMGNIYGEIDERGKPLTFYLDQKQKNLLSFLFELPESKVKAGDIWKLSANLIDLGMGFNCEEANKLSKVTLKSVAKNEKNESVALIYYLLAESVKGIYDNPATGEKSPSATTVIMIGQGHFNIAQNRWDKVMSRINFKSNQPMETEMQQEFTLEFLPSLPEEYVK